MKTSGSFLSIVLSVALLTSISLPSYPKDKTDKFFAKGGDISWLPQMEASGYTFYDDNGDKQDCFQILKEHGFNTIRLRTWVNPSDNRASGHCSKEETVAMAVRAQKWGMKVMIDFHYSDSWADPSKQKKPAAWEGHDFAQLQKDLYDYTLEVMKALKESGVTPEWVQVGNETPGGMIYPEGSVANWPQLAQLINKGYEAIKAVSPTSKVILHIDRGNDNKRFRTWFDNAKSHGTKYDVIGLSYYPYWLDGHPDYTLSIDDLGKNLNDMASRYDKEVMVVEVGGEDTKVQNTYDMLIAVQEKVKAVPNGKGLGVIYWEPQGARSWSRYALSAWGEDGRPTKALDAFQ
ncbi:MAG: arabinogalactan endo-1,4-beta-galactosidase [Bacteroidales bacterium]|nr:arabinogalactan endo-1,4-beta-galactosidase [Bacteroidales bacterium]